MQRIIIFSAILFCLFITGVQCLQLAPVQVGPVAKYNFAFNIADQRNDPTTLMRSFANNKLHVPSGDLDKIAKDIILSMGIEGSQTRHMKWSFHVTNTVGTLSIYEIHALISASQVHVTGASATMTQQIPALYDVREQCARTGKRKYGIAGPRK